VTKTVVGRTGLTSTNTFEASAKQIKEAKEQFIDVRKEYNNLVQAVQKGENTLSNLRNPFKAQIEALDELLAKSSPKKIKKEIKSTDTDIEVPIEIKPHVNEIQGKLDEISKNVKI